MENDDKKINDYTLRFNKILEKLSLTGYSIEKISKIGKGIITKQKISDIKKEKYNVSLEIISEFCSLYPQINTDYIVTGRGTPIRGNDNAVVGSIDPNSLMIAHLKLIESNAELAKTVATLSKELAELKSQKGGAADANSAAPKEAQG